MEWKRCVQQYCTNDGNASEHHQRDVKIIANAVQERNIQLINIVEELGTTITSTDISLRERGIKLLSEVLNSLPNDFLTSKEVETMSDFMLLRLQDHHTVVPHALQGLLALSQSSNLPKGYASKIILSIFKEVHVPSQLQNDRYAVYQIIATFLQSHLEDLKAVESMVFGFVQVLDGERDPRCLLIGFHIVPQLVKHFDIGPFAEDLFEVMACYFPIDFNPRSIQNMTICKEDLAAALHRCLVLTPKFAPYLMPLLLEKLESDVPAARLDSYEVLEASCKVFSAKDFHPFLKPLWTVIRKEVFMGHDEKLRYAALKSLSALMCVLSPSNSSYDTGDFSVYLEEILKECEHHLCQPEFTSVSHSAEILAAVASSSFIAADKTFSSVMPLLLQQYAVQTQVNQRKAILDMAVKLVISIKQISCGNGRNPLEKFHDSILSLFFSVLDDSISQELSSLGLCALYEALDVENFLGENHLELLSHHLIHILVSGERENLRVKGNATLSKLARLYPAVILDHIMPALKKQLYELDTSNTANFNKILEAFVSASSCVDVLKDSLESMITFLGEQMSGQISSMNSVLTAKSLLSAITCHLSAVSLPPSYITSSIMEPLMVISLRVAFSENLMEKEKFEAIEVMCDVIHKLICISDFSLILPYVEAVMRLHLSETIPEIFGNISLSTGLNVVSSSCKTILLFLLKCMLASIPWNSDVPYVSDLLEHLKAVAVESEDLCVSKLGAQCISIIINKMHDHNQLQVLLDSLRDYLVSVIEEQPDSFCRSVQNALVLWIWISKALVLRSHPQMVSFINQLISWFKCDLLGSAAAGGISTIVEDSPKEFSTDGHACVKLLYRQRFFIETSPQLCKGYNEASGGYKSNYLIALCSQLKYLPKMVLISELPSLLPIILQSLNHNVVDLQLAVLTCLEEILNDDPSLLEDFLNDLVPQLLTLGLNGSMKIKIHSLTCLAYLCSIPGHFLLPLRQEVIQKLKPCLDDKKRLVRKAAVEARCKWFLLGQPGS